MGIYDRSFVLSLPEVMAALPVPAAPAAPLRIRDLRPVDAPLLDELHAGLSPRSRYQRYHGPKPTLSPRERAYLAATDGRDHVALVALDAHGAPIGVARYVRETPESADIAVEVIDAWQRRGLGSALLARLAPRAAAAGVSRFTATVLFSTGLRRALVRRGWRVVTVDGTTTTLDVDVWALLARR
jgi:GNAT superfamily N-acetyltransferase